MPEYYLRIEAVNLDHSVYDTYDISTIRGGSFMLHNAFEGVEQTVKQGGLCSEFKDIGSAASVGLFRFKTDEINHMEAIINPILDEIRKGIQSFATLVWALRSVNKNESFTDALNHLLAECRWKQYQNASLTLPQEKSQEKACDIDGVRPGVYPDKKGDQDIKVSTAVRDRKKEGRGLRKSLYEALLKDSFPALLQENDDIVTDDLETLSSRKGAGKLDGKIAFIYLDGNRFGRTREEKCRDAELYREFQETVQDKLRKPALRQILEFALKPENSTFLTDDRRIRLETLLWGGDEIEWVVPAWQALNVLELFFETTQAANNFHGVKLTHSAGVVFCHHNLPILQIRRYAHDLCDIAKESISKNIHEIDPATDDRFAFLNIVSFDYMSGDTREFLKDYYFPASESDFVIPANDIADLKTHLPTLKKHFPANKLHDMLQALQKGKAGEVQSIQERAVSLLPEGQRTPVNLAIEKLIAGQPNRWFRTADLMRYVE